MWIYRNALLVSLFCFVAISTEAYCGKRSGILRELERKVTHLHSDIDSKMIPNGELVFFRSNNTLFNLVSDPDFKVAEFCGDLERKVQYCMWDEVMHSRNVNNHTEYYYTYHKIWSSHPINSFFFHNPMYHNPSVQIIPHLHFQNSMKAGTFTISDKLSFNGPKKTLEPHNQQLDQFASSPYSSEFQYAGRGIFYSEYKKGYLDGFLKIAQFFDLSSSQGFSSWCEPGDRRIWYEYWAPDSVTVLGKYYDGVIELTEYKGYSIGSITSGHVDVRKALSQNMLLFPVIMKWICRAAIAGYLIMCIYHKQQPEIFSVIAVLASIILSHPVVNNNFYTNKSITYIVLFSGIATLPIAYYQFSQVKSSENEHDQHPRYD